GRARRRLAGQGRAPALAPGRRGRPVPGRSGRHAAGAAARVTAGVWLQREIELQARPGGFHLVTDEIVDRLPELGRIGVGIAHLFLRHTSASLTSTRTPRPTCVRDFESWFDRAVPEGADY